MTTGGMVTIDIGLEAMPVLDVARRTKEYAAGNMNVEAIVKLKLMLAYIMLYLTMRYGCLPWMRAHEDIFVSNQALDSCKLEVFQTRLADQGAYLTLDINKDKVRYEKVL